MNTRASTYDASRPLGIGWSATVSPIQVESAALLLICVTLAVGAYLSFPLYDDGWLALLIRESGPSALAHNMGDRPIFGFLLERMASFGPANKLAFVILNSVLWLGFAIESRMLFRKLFPEFEDYAIVPACLTLAPIVLQTQLSTALVVIPANLATMLGYAALLVLLQDRNEPVRTSRLAVAMTLAASGVAISEYGVAANLVGCAILVGAALISSTRIKRHQFLAGAGWLFAVTCAAYILFAKIVDFSVRPDISPAQVLHRDTAKWMAAPFEVVAGAWYSLFGAYATALGNVTLAWDSKSTLIGILSGLVLAILLCLAIRGRRSMRSFKGRPAQVFRRLTALLPAILVGLLPFGVMGRAVTLLEFGSRFRIPIMPVAAVMTTGFALYVVRSSARWIPAAVFGFIVGYSSWISSYTAVVQTKSIAAIQSALKPYVAQSNDYTVAVVPFKRFETELTAILTSAWPLDLEKRLWVVSEEPALSQFGSRRDCRLNTTLGVRVRGLTRMGKLGQLLWIDTPFGKPVSIDPYCQKLN